MSQKGLQIRGVIGLLRWSYYTAAAIHGYTVRRDKKTQEWSLVATVVQSDAFKLKQRPLVFVAPLDKGSWSWEVEDFDFANGTLRARLMPPDTARG